MGEPSTPASDAYAMGVVMWECATLRLPWERETVWEVSTVWGPSSRCDAVLLCTHAAHGLPCMGCRQWERNRHTWRADESFARLGRSSLTHPLVPNALSISR